MVIVVIRYPFPRRVLPQVGVAAAQDSALVVPAVGLLMLGYVELLAGELGSAAAGSSSRASSMLSMATRNTGSGW
ncbi:MAG: hypothetical protein ACJ74U_04410 [Jatrophihabitantaceae bacterium]